MPEQLHKLRPDRDLQCYFERPSAVAALSEASATGFTVSGSWRQQSDWAVVEWNRDNVFEHPSLRNLPDGDLSGIQLTYEETRNNCIPLDSSLYATVDWPTLRIWTEQDGVSALYKVRLKDHSTAVAGVYKSASARLGLQGTPTPGDYIEVSWLTEHYNYRIVSGDSLSSIAAAIAQIICLYSPTVQATAEGESVRLTFASESGHNANRIGVYGSIHGSGTVSWTPAAVYFAGGESPNTWKIELDFSMLRDTDGNTVPTRNVRKLRWTWAADLTTGDFVRSEFSVVVTKWTVIGSNLLHQIAGPGSYRIEDDSAVVSYDGAWTEVRGNYSGGSIRHTVQAGATVTCRYKLAAAHTLYLGTRRSDATGSVNIQIDGGTPQTVTLRLPGEDMLVRFPLGSIGADADHTVTVTNAGDGAFYFDFLEAALPTTDLPDFPASTETTLATDWDTDHSIAIAPERTAWLMTTLGFIGRANHYAGALWFYELERPGHVYAKATVTFGGTPEWSKTTRLTLGPTVIEHVNLIGDTPASVAQCFEFLINAGSTGVWARADGVQLHITSHTMGAAGNGLWVDAETDSTSFTANVSGALAGGQDGTWKTDLTSAPRINRAARDWSRSYFRSLIAAGITCTAAFSMELQHGDPDISAGIAQRYPNGDPAWLNTPAIQTNFSPASLAFWRQVYADMAQVMSEAGVIPYLQFGEVQWWYFPGSSGMPFYDAYTTSTFEALYGRPMRTIANEWAAPTAYNDEVEHLARLIGEFTAAIMEFVRVQHPDTRFEVLYPPDVNDTDLNRLVNLPTTYWTPAALDCFKSESFTYTGNRDLNKARESIEAPLNLGFPRSKSSHLIGIGEHTTPWRNEHRIALGEGLESIVLFALDQYCLIGYEVPPRRSARRATRQGQR